MLQYQAIAYVGLKNFGKITLNSCNWQELLII